MHLMGHNDHEYGGFYDTRYLCSGVDLTLLAFLLSGMKFLAHGEWGNG